MQRAFEGSEGRRELRGMKGRRGGTERWVVGDKFQEAVLVKSVAYSTG